MSPGPPSKRDLCFFTFIPFSQQVTNTSFLSTFGETCVRVGGGGAVCVCVCVFFVCFFFTIESHFLGHLDVR